ncbi:MAG: GNAT family N-acetyltransferase [Elainella sp. C42_A2020_010]|nr:GNAT family N-acetyltransferase [Elainella sp. C42_A2020_010]RNJ68076.1 MAG: GNAT family N-acetyltransferase [Leptolyngbya sp. IPPAS B-1204]
MIHIALADSQLELEHCFPIMQGLRPHVISVEEFIKRVQQQQQEYGYRLAYLKVEDSKRNDQADGLAPDTIKAVAGFRISENLAWGKFLYVDDLVTAATERSKGHGEQLIHWLIDYARQHQCQSFQLDSGVQRFAAHRFYFRHRLEITSYHFTLNL